MTKGRGQATEYGEEKEKRGEGDGHVTVEERREDRTRGRRLGDDGRISAERERRMYVKDRLEKSGRRRADDERLENLAGSSELHSLARVRPIGVRGRASAKRSRPFLAVRHLTESTHTTRQSTEPGIIRFNGRSSYGP